MLCSLARRRRRFPWWIAESVGQEFTRYEFDEVFLFLKRTSLFRLHLCLKEALFIAHDSDVFARVSEDEVRRSRPFIPMDVGRRVDSADRPWPAGECSLIGWF